MNAEHNIDDVALTATFMVGGMLEYDWKNCEKQPGGRNTRDVYTIWDQGGLELHAEMIGYAKVLTEACHVITKGGTVDFPGVIDYEVSEPFGMWFAEQLYKHGSVSRAAGVARLKRMIAKFFAQAFDEEPAYHEGFFTGVIREVKYV